MPLEQLPEGRMGAPVLVKPARNHAKRELSRVRLEALDIADAVLIIRRAQKGFEIIPQCVQLLLKPGVAVRQNDLVEIDVPLVMLCLLAAEAIHLLPQRFVADTV